MADILRPVTPASILAAKLQTIASEIASLDSIPESLRKEIEFCNILAGGLDPYLEDNSGAPSTALEQLDDSTREIDWKAAFESGQTGIELESEMVSGKLEGQFLALLVRLLKPQRILEIGMFTGYSALAMAEALTDGATVLACELDAYAAKVAKKAFDQSPAGERISIRVAPALETLSELADEGETFDFVFLDADKPGYGRYYDLLLDRDLLRPGGFLAVDNTLLQGEPWTKKHPSINGRSVHRFNRKVAEDPRTEQVIVPIRDGVTLIRRAE
ncbi:MAG: class I SAM-dependent methyltransferase [Verrucomicrobiota bacterium]